MRIRTRLERLEQQTGNELAPESMVELIRQLKTEQGLESAPARGQKGRGTQSAD